MSGEPGRFQVTIQQQPRYIDMQKCIACGLCAEKCPQKVTDTFNQGLVRRRAAYVLYPQAVPLKYAIDAKACIYLQRGKCGACAKLCPAGAVNFDDAPRRLTLNVGAIVVTSGFVPYDPRRYDVYGYQRFANVITSLEFERMLSTSGPFSGQVVRPFDHKKPKKIAWLQCVGSRDVHPGAGRYCSAVCCTNAIKEAVVAKERVAGLDTAIFYIDMRTQGKDFETYYIQSRDKYGVRFIKSRIAEVEQTDGCLLRIAYTDQAGRRYEEDFDILVLSVGMCLHPDNRKLSGKLGIELDTDGFPVTSSFTPVNTSRPNVLVCGAAHSPQDISSSVISASAAVGAVGAAMSDARWSQIKAKSAPVQQDIQGLAPRIGVFICHCGSNIAGVVDVEAVAEYARTLPHVAYATTSQFSCSQDTQKTMAETIKHRKLNRVVVAACTPRSHETLFQETLQSAGLNKYLFEMANIRNHCSWVHVNEPQAATRKSKDLVRMAVQKSTLMQPLYEQEVQINQEALVIGGGLAGLTAAKNMARQGFVTHLIEKSDRLGGQAHHILETWKGEDVAIALDELIHEVQSDTRIQIYMNAQVRKVTGSMGHFTTTIQNNGSPVDIEHGAAIIATGASELKPKEHLYGSHARVMTALELDALLKAEEDGFREVQSIVFIQCVGSRIPQRPYCSKVCCTHSVKNALKLKSAKPQMQVYILYRDMRTYGLRENLYRQAREEGIHFLRYDHEDGLEVQEHGEALQVTFTDDVLDRRLSLNPDMLILATAIVPPVNSRLAQAFKVPVNADGFFNEAHVKMRPVDFATDGIFVCGLAHGPNPVDETVAQAQAAAARAAIVLSKPTIQVGGRTASVDQEMCTGCGVCSEVCPYSAIALNAKLVAEVNTVLCKGCGLCSASCRSGAAALDGFADNEIFAQIFAL